MFNPFHSGVSDIFENIFINIENIAEYFTVLKVVLIISFSWICSSNHGLALTLYCPYDIKLRWRSTNLLDMFIFVFSSSSRFQRIPKTLVGSQWFLNLLPNQAWAASLAAQAWFGRRFKNHWCMAVLGGLGSKGLMMPAHDWMNKFKIFRLLPTITPNQAKWPNLWLILL